MSDYMTFTNTFNVLRVERLKNSRNGNPKFRFVFDNNLTMQTPTDAGWVYGISPHAIENTKIRVKYRTSVNGSDYTILGIAC